METKVPFYSVVNILLPGLIFIGACIFLFLDYINSIVTQMATINSAGFEILLTLSALAIAYEVGYIIFRLGAIVIEPILKKVFGWTNHEDFVAAQKAGAKSLEMLSREYGYARTQITLFISLVIVSAFRAKWWFLVICVILIVLFMLTVRGHMKKISTTVNEYLPAEKIEVTNGKGQKVDNSKGLRSLCSSNR
jgi:hypothetical protein